MLFQRIFYPSETEGNTSTARQVTSVSGTIWSMCFISKEFCQPSKEHNPVLAILLNRYGNALLWHREFAVLFQLMK